MWDARFLSIMIEDDRVVDGSNVSNGMSDLAVFV